MADICMFFHLVTLRLVLFFCDNQIKDRCVSNSKDTIYYSDDDHLSVQGSALVVEDIVDMIKRIKN